MSEASTLRAELAVSVGALALQVSLETSGTLVVVGPNGAGKTTLLLALLGALRAARGRIALGEEVLFDTEARIDVPLERRRLGYVPQHYALFPHLDVRGNLALAIGSAWPELDRAERDARADVQLRALDLSSLATRRASALSSGEQQRVSLARALAASPRALLLDEPLAALDVHARAAVRTALAARLAGLAVPCIVVTHDPADARLLGSAVAVMEDGKITQRGTWAELSARPATRFVQAIVAADR